MTPLPDTGIHLLEPRDGAAAVPAQWGVPWPRGALQDAPLLDLDTDRGSTPVDTWVTARWPDGTVKWTGHAGLAPTGQGRLALRKPQAERPDAPGVQVRQGAGGEASVVSDRLTLDVGPGPAPIRRLLVEGREVGRAGRIVATSATSAHPQAPRREHRVLTTEVRVERAGAQQAVLRLAGRHEVDGEQVLPFVLRLYVTAGSPRVRAVHSIVWDADPQRLFLTSLGLRLEVPLREAPYDRHIRLAGSAGGFLTEAVQGVTGLRRDPGPEVRRAQVEGRPTPPLAEWAETVSGRLRFVPCWDAWTLRQLSPDGYTLAKRTDAEHPWIAAPGGTRSLGYAYVGDTGGGIGAGLRDFWKTAPTQLDVAGARGDAASLTVWLYSPAAEPMDLRFYHDGLGQDTYADQLEALEITYEDHEPGFGDARGIARTHELVIDAFPATPPAAELSAFAEACALPPQPVVAPERMHGAGVFGIWAPVDRSTPQRAHLEDRLEFLREYYVGQVEQRRWYGFWDYGDVMHTYDPDRHTWRYDVGGYAWDNSELSPDLWLWTDFLRSGDASVFRLAEAMSRHTGEVDQYHAGPFTGLGTRHNVQHFGCSAKQLRVSSAVYRRHHYFLTADERVGELLDEVAASEEALLRVDATRKVRTDVYAPDRRALAIGLGTDLGALLGAWLTAWERHDDPDAEQKIRGALAGIGALPQGLFTGEALWDLDARRFDTSRDRIQVSHLAAVFGMAEIVPELLDLVEDEGFARAWDEYCRYYLAAPEEQAARFGAPLRGISLIPAYSRLLAQHAAAADDAAQAERAWDAFLLGEGDQVNSDAMVARADWSLARIDGPTVHEPVDEAAFLGTNGCAQYGLSAIANLALIDDHLPQRIPYMGPAAAEDAAENAGEER